MHTNYSWKRSHLLKNAVRNKLLQDHKFPNYYFLLIFKIMFAFVVRVYKLTKETHKRQHEGQSNMILCYPWIRYRISLIFFFCYGVKPTLIWKLIDTSVGHNVALIWFYCLHTNYQLLSKRHQYFSTFTMN